MNEQIPVNLQDLYLLIGEKETLRFLMQKEIDRQNQQIVEMSEEITNLRQQLNGKLGQSEDNDPIRHLSGRMQGAGFGFGSDVPGQSDESSSGNDQTSPFSSEIAGMGRSNMARSSPDD